MSQSSIRASLGVPDTVEVGDAADVTVSVRGTLHNGGSEPFVVTAPEGEPPYFCHVLNDQHREVCRHQDEGDRTRLHVSVTVTPAHPVHDGFEVAIPNRKLRDGKRYTVRAVLYGHPAEASFVALRPKVKPEKPSGKSSKPAAKKSRTSKRK